MVFLLSVTKLLVVGIQRQAAVMMDFEYGQEE
jgi:hypothetical protein